MIDLQDSIVSALKGRYEVERELGRGGMAVVYLARDVRNHRKVALKVMRPELSDALGTDRFLQEIAIAAPLVHPNIMAVHDSGEAAGFLYYTMPFVEGPTLRQRLERERQLPLDDALSIARQVASALDHAHARGTVHRDIKPENILLLGEHVLVADFGLARAITQAASRPLTTKGIVVGTPAYMSPEQCTPGGTVTAASDVYSLACVVYEMIAGVPPFRAPTADVMMSHHQVSMPPSVCEQRRSCPAALDLVVRRALAKTPADRYRTAGEFVNAMQRAIEAESTDRLSPDPHSPQSNADRSPWRTARKLLPHLVGAAVLAAIVIGINSRKGRAGALDPSRIVVFPLRDDRPGAGNEASSEAVSTYIGYALEETRPLKWLEARNLIEEGENLATFNPPASRRLTGRAGAAYFIDGSIIRGADSVVVVLRLHSVAGDSVVRVAGASGPVSAYLPRLALRAVSALLPTILEPNRKIDLRSLSDRSTTAIANFLQGEREYRRMQFSSALDHYASAVREDSAFALAALKGAQTATWVGRPVADTLLIDVALRNIDKLTPAQRMLARGMAAHLGGNADSAVAQLRLLTQTDPLLPEAWALLGEVYARSLTSVVPAESLARVSLQRARALDPDFAPALLLLEEMALREGDLREAERLKTGLDRAGADTTHSAGRDIMWRCVSKGPNAVRWADVARKDAASTLDAGRVLARQASQAACAKAALRSVLRDDSASFAQRHGAMRVLNGLLIATGDTAELRALLASPDAADLPKWQFHLLAAAAGQGFEKEAALEADSLRASHARMGAPDLWLVGSWAARAGNVPRLLEISRLIRTKADSSHARRDVLLARLIEARMILAQGDTVGAIDSLRAIKPNGPRRAIAWQASEGLGLERLLLADLLAARGRHAEALQVASQLDATEPVAYLLFLRPSLQLRERSAAAAGNEKLALHYRDKLRRLSQ